MKIYNNQYLTDAASVSYINRQKEKAEKSASKGSAASSFDSITISSAHTPTPETSFKEAMASRISLETRQNASSQKIDQLKNQIQGGTYTVDSALIAEKLMN